MSRVVYLSLVLLLSMLVLPMATTAQGNSEAAHACQNGGYLNYTDVEGGDPFRNADQCTSYAARGGTLEPISTANVTLTWASYFFFQDTICYAVVTVTGLPTDGLYDVQVVTTSGEIEVVEGAGSWTSSDPFDADKLDGPTTATVTEPVSGNEFTSAPSEPSCPAT